MSFRQALFSATRSRRVLLRSVAAGGILSTTAFFLSTTDSFGSIHHQAEQDVPLNYPVPAPVALPLSREEQIKKLETEQFDLLIIGGGATGAGCALDAVSRGLKVALVERDDFACGTSSRSTKLVHGGVRYLEKAFWNLDYEQYKLVKEALAERATFLKIAPHLSFPLPIMVPVYKWWQVPYYWAGTKMYDLIAGKENMESSYFMGRGKTLENFPMLKPQNLKGAIVYYDGSHNDSRMNTAIALTAAQKGAVILNHMEVTELSKDSSGRVNGAVVRDNDGTAGKIQVDAKGVINATGPFADWIRQLDTPVATDIVAPSSGVHVILPDYYCSPNMGLIDPATSDGRVVFFLPWQGHTLAGTTDSPTTVSKDPIPSEDEISWILNEIQHYVADDITVRREDVLAAWSGIRPLVRDPRAKNTESLVRNHLITLSDSGLLTVAGGKWTTYREMAEDTVNTSVKEFGLHPTAPCGTKDIKLVGAEGYRKLMFIHLIQTFGIETDIAKHLADNYGDRAYDVVRLSATTGERWPTRGIKLSPAYPFIDGEIRYAVQHEYARTAVDVLSRRIRLAFLNSKAALESLPKVIDIMAEELKWDKARQDKEWDDTIKFLYSMGLQNGKYFSRADVESGKTKMLG
ncbi:FAD dependent oxidoreductase-domain-containing protein [Lipomyces doorenjongii]|uniref:FAD dependent oxidoreductase-domain-containing protein n=1 Tax=Lipomyces doorenjongii TaxID=383834 RepID=UPI0034CEAD60